MRTGKLGLGTPWTRDAFTLDDILDIEARIPDGYRVNLIAHDPRNFTVVGLIESGDPLQHPIELFRTTRTRMPYPVALSMCERLEIHAEEARQDELEDLNREGQPEFNGAFK